jgi:Fe2+ transport system protein FeoA
MRCAMCGYEFEQAELNCHAGCPLGGHCAVICCPRCGYSTVDPLRTSLASRLLHLFGQRGGDLILREGKFSSEPANTRSGVMVRLLDLRPGESGHISDIEAWSAEPAESAETKARSATLASLSQYGLLPGTPVRLTQKRPVPIVEVGQTELALDYSVAAEICVDL